MRHVLVIWVALALAACAIPNAHKTEKLRLGMAKEEVLNVLGRPASVGADKEAEILYYRMLEAGSTPLGSGHSITVYVRLVGGKVESFGRIAEPDPQPVIVTSPAPPPVIVTTPAPPSR
jgi:hypothetical protein